jgi:murein DD-endopeptidase MepM/ murein hydrolase activator NlpD
MQGQLFRIYVQPSDGERISDARGSVFGETLHFEPTDAGGMTAVAGVPVDARRDIALELNVRSAGGIRETIRVTVPVFASTFAHEELRVAPRFGSPPSPEDRERRARDAARARAVSEAAHRTRRLWTSETILPRVDRVTSEFGNGRVFNGQVSSRHMGLDLDGETGDTVYAAARGRVELVDEFLLAGNIVYLNHGAGLVSGYFHLSEQLVEEGQVVEPGTPIGRIGATGRVTGPHLHWVVRYGHISVDPRTLLEVLEEGAGQ